MSYVLLLTAEEQKAFQALPDALKEGWNVQTETITATERPDELSMRYRIAHFTDPVCKALADAAQGAKTLKDFEAAAAMFNPSKLNQEQLGELFFVLGTRAISSMITYLLWAAKDDEDLEGIAVMTSIRRMLIEANAL